MSDVAGIVRRADQTVSHYPGNGSEFEVQFLLNPYYLCAIKESKVITGVAVRADFTGHE